MDKTTENNKNEEVKQQEQEEQQEATPLSQEEESFQSKFLRLNADFQNYKRRVEKERFEWMTEAQVIILDKLLPVFDELDRAIELSKADSSSDQKEEWIKGFKLIQKNWKKTLSDLKVKEINGNEDFNPELHDALMQVDAEDKKAGEIVQLLAKGYKYKDKVVKHAKVSVAK